MSRKLKYCVNNVFESLDDLENCLKIYNQSDDPNIKSVSVNSMRMSIVQIQEELKEILLTIYTINHKAVTPDENILIRVKFCMDKGYFPKCDLNVFKLLRDYRNYSCYGYKKPEADDIIKFCDNIDLLREEFSGLLKSTDGLKKSNSFNK